MSSARYEIRATGWPKPEKTTVDRTGDLHSAHQMMRGIKKAPGCTEAEIFDHQAQRVVMICGG